MISLNKNNFLTEKSKIFDQLADAKMEDVGTENPISLPVVKISAIGQTIGPKITDGNVGSIYQVNETAPARVYKIIPYNNFKNGDEIRISKIASELGVAPMFYSACLVEQSSSKFILIEMEEAGKTLGKWMEDLAPEEPEQVPVIETLSEQEIWMQEMRKKFQKESGITVTMIQKKERISIEEAANKLYGNEETLYYELFSKIKILAESCISYSDSHVGNIIPNCENEKDLQLIDFDAAKIMPSVREAKCDAIMSLYNQTLINQFKKVPGLSEKSLKLIRWFLPFFRKS